MLVSLKLKFAESKLYCCEVAEFLESGTPIDIALNALNSDTKKNNNNKWFQGNSVIPSSF